MRWGISKEAKSAALRYAPDMEAPLLTAYARGAKAEKMRKLAQRHQVPVESAEDWVLDMLSQVPPGKQIPEALYGAVAIIFREIYAAGKEDRGRDS